MSNIYFFKKKNAHDQWKWRKKTIDTLVNDIFVSPLGKLKRAERDDIRKNPKI